MRNRRYLIIGLAFGIVVALIVVILTRKSENIAQNLADAASNPIVGTYACMHFERNAAWAYNSMILSADGTMFLTEDIKYLDPNSPSSGTWNYNQTEKIINFTYSEEYFIHSGYPTATVGLSNTIQADYYFTDGDVYVNMICDKQ